MALLSFWFSGKNKVEVKTELPQHWQPDDPTEDVSLSLTVTTRGERSVNVTALHFDSFAEYKQLLDKLNEGYKRATEGQSNGSH